MRKILSAVLALFIAALPGYSAPRFEADGRRGALRFVRVARVVDGDTILVTPFNGAEPERVDMAGIDAPDGYEYYGKEASEYTTAMLSNRDVWLQFGTMPRGRRGSPAVYVWTEKPQKPNDEEEVRWQMFNARLLMEGYARASQSRTNPRYARMFAKFQREARERNRGLWWEH